MFTIVQYYNVQVLNRNVTAVQNKLKCKNKTNRRALMYIPTTCVCIMHVCGHVYTEGIVHTPLFNTVLCVLERKCVHVAPVTDHFINPTRKQNYICIGLIYAHVTVPWRVKICGSTPVYDTVTHRSRSGGPYNVDTVGSVFVLFENVPTARIHGPGDILLPHLPSPPTAQPHNKTAIPWAGIHTRVKPHFFDGRINSARVRITQRDA